MFLRSVAVFATVAISFALASCEKSQQLEKCEDVQEVTKIPSTIETFAKALSAAVYQHEEMRFFIKDEALKQFDKDYDVFYPFVKDEEIAEGKTFREFLLGYLSEPELDRIEAEHPLLDIAVPDWSLIEGFSVDSWDTTDQDLSIGYKNEKGGLSLFNNGEREFETMSGQIPGFPTLIVKDTNDDLGTAILNYSAPVILSRDTVDGVSGFRINEIDTGFVYMLILPKYE